MRFSFNLRQMFYAVTLMSIALGATVWLARHLPKAFLFAFIFSCPIGLSGFGVVILAAVMLFSVYTSDNTTERKLNIAKCTNLALIGTLMLTLPMLLAIATFLILPIVQRG